MEQKNKPCNKRKSVQLVAKCLAVFGLFGAAIIIVQRQQQSVVQTERDIHPRVLSRHAREAEDDCTSNETVTSEGGTIVSPGFPNRYPSNLDCRWLLTSHDDSAIVLRLKSLDIEKDRACELDYLEVYLGSSTLAPSLQRFCGTIRNRIVDTNSSTVLIAFHTDLSYEDKGFSIEYYLQSATGCSPTLTAGTGTVNSPNFPANYPDSTECWTLISVEDEKKILFQFSVLDLEFDENCTYDFVEIFDGASRDAQSLGRFCSPSQKVTIHSTSSKLLINFHSDHLVNKKGFQAQYTTVLSFGGVDLNKLGGCLWEKGDANGSIASPNYPQKYSSDANCNILITAPVGDVITVVFDTLQLEVDANCSYDYVEIIEGSTKGLQVHNRFCGKPNEKKKYTSVTNNLLITFRSDNFAEFSGFKAHYWFHQLHNETEVEKKDENSSDSSETIEIPKPSSEMEDVFLEKPQNSTLAVGSSYMLLCAVSDPVAKIRWLKDEQFLGGTTPLPGVKLVANNTLWIQSMSKQLVGIYTCAAVTPEKIHYAKAWLRMENDVSPQDTSCNIVLRKRPRDASFTEGEFAHMECLAAGNQVQVHWEKDGVRIETKKHITVLRNGFLFMDKISIEDAGSYTCVATDLTSGCQKSVVATLTVNEKAKLMEVCGKPKAGQPSKSKPRLDHGKIIGGSNAKKGAYPWQVMLWEANLKSFCGGSLINERWIITAAHCFINYKGLRWDDIIIKIGKHNREAEEEEEFQTVIAEPSAVVVHPAYLKETFDNDIALVRLRDHVKFSDYILPVCLGDRQLLESITNNKRLTMGTVTGWGKLKEKGASPKYLQEIRLPLVDQETCINSTTFQVTRNMFCAGYSQEIVGDACHGDSGGPFVINYNNRWYLFGIVSWGEGCGMANKYGFYTRISNYLPWIKGIMKS